MTFLKAKAASIFLLLLLWHSSTLFCAAKPLEAEWILSQNEEDFGDCTVYVCHDGAKVVSTKLGCNLVCKAPDWKVHCFNVAEKTEWIGELKQFNGVVMANPFAMPDPHKFSRLREVGVGEFKGLKYIKYRTPYSSKDLVLASTDIAVAEQIGEFLARLYVVPDAHAVPLFRECDRGRDRNVERFKAFAVRNGSANDLRGGVLHKLVTKSWKKIAFNESDFAIPKGFVRKKDIIQVSYSAGRKEELGSFLNELGFKTRTKP